MASGGIHIATGFAIGTRCRSIPAAFLAGTASHAALDALPHHDYRHLAAHAGDAVVGLALTGVPRCGTDDEVLAAHGLHADDLAAAIRAAAAPVAIGESSWTPSTTN